MRDLRVLAFQGLIEKLKIKLYPNYQLLLNMEQESAKTSKAYSNSEATNESTLRENKDTIVNFKDNALANLYFLTFEKCPEAPEAIRKQQWLTPTRLKQLQTPKR